MSTPAQGTTVCSFMSAVPAGQTLVDGSVDLSVDCLTPVKDQLLNMIAKIMQNYHNQTVEAPYLVFTLKFRTLSEVAQEKIEMRSLGYEIDSAVALVCNVELPNVAYKAEVAKVRHLIDLIVGNQDVETHESVSAVDSEFVEFASGELQEHLARIKNKKSLKPCYFILCDGVLVPFSTIIPKHVPQCSMFREVSCECIVQLVDVPNLTVHIRPINFAASDSHLLKPSGTPAKLNTASMLSSLSKDWHLEELYEADLCLYLNKLEDKIEYRVLRWSPIEGTAKVPDHFLLEPSV